MCWILGSTSWLLHSQPGGLFHQVHQGGTRLTKIVLTGRTSEQLALDSTSHRADSWDQVVCPPHLLQVLHIAASLSRQGVSRLWNLGGPGVYGAQLAHPSIGGSR